MAALVTAPPEVAQLGALACRDVGVGLERVAVPRLSFPFRALPVVTIPLDGGGGVGEDEGHPPGMLLLRTPFQCVVQRPCAPCVCGVVGVEIPRLSVEARRFEVEGLRDDGRVGVRVVRIGRRVLVFAAGRE